MESLALLVMFMFLIQFALGLVALIFAIIYRRTGKFKVTTTVLVALLALETVWALITLPAFGYPSLAFLVASALLRFLERK